MFCAKCILNKKYYLYKYSIINTKIYEKSFIKSIRIKKYAISIISLRNMRYIHRLSSIEGKSPVFFDNYYKMA